MKASQPELDVDVVLAHVRYDPKTGEIRWKKVPLRSRKAEVGSVADYATLNGYRVVYLLGRWVYSHRIAWASAWMVWPSGVIDHINRNPGDNRWANLRLATRSQNQCNHKRREDNRSGFKGVGWSIQKGMWRVRVRFCGKEHHGGFFNELDDAVRAATKLRQKHQGKFANHG